MSNFGLLTCSCGASIEMGGGGAAGDKKIFSGQKCKNRAFDFNTFEIILGSKLECKKILLGKNPPCALWRRDCLHGLKQANCYAGNTGTGTWSIFFNTRVLVTSKH